MSKNGYPISKVTVTTAFLSPSKLKSAKKDKFLNLTSKNTSESKFFPSNDKFIEKLKLKKQMISPSKLSNYSFNQNPIPPKIQTHYVLTSPNHKDTAGVNIMNFLSNRDKVPIDVSNVDLNFNCYESAKTSVKPYSYIKSYAVNTCQGIVR